MAVQSEEQAAQRALSLYTNHTSGEVLHQVVDDFRIKFIDDAEFIPAQVDIKFDNGKQIAILIAEELNLDESIPNPLEYEFGGEIYLFHDEELLK